MGYDLATYFIKLISAKGEAFPNALAAFEQSHVLQSRLKFRKLSENGGYVNEGMYNILNNENGTYVLE